MFDHSPWGGVSVTRAPETVNQEFCQHVYSNEPIPVKLAYLPDDGWEFQMEGKAFKCTMCKAYLVLRDRAG